ncbi:OmpP1/FadL family transporter [Flavobacterium sp.]|uniref:OmpP1/FadL family transporter n=1 Tax=Flavobacterium sp. TaxID=239 RepID=UPI00375210E9
MKKTFFTVFVGLIFISSQAQDINDALRYSKENLNGTARFRAMSGAFGALGGDLSAIGVNPAGSVIFANNQAGFTLSNFNTKNDSNYFGKLTSENNNSFDLNQAGAVFVFDNNDQKSDWKKFALALNYDNTGDLDNSIFSSGTNPNNSISNYFLSYANGLPLSTVIGNDFDYADLFFNEQQAYLGYQSYIINSTDDTNPNNTQYVSGVAPGGNYIQEYTLESSGYNGKLSFNASGQYTDKFSFGINLNSHFVDYRQSTSFFERNNNNTSTTDLVKRLRFNNDLYTYGNGFSFQLGTIFKPTKEVRLGLAYESPTWLTLNDEISQDITAVSSSSAGELSPDVVNPNLTVIFEPYRLQTPSKFTGSFAYVFGKKGLISIDYAVKDYSNTTYKPKRDFTTTNATMSNLLDASSEVRVGGEYKIKKLSLRGGYRFEKSPYKDGKTIGDLTGYSGGLGYNFGSTKLDLSYSYAQRDYNQQFFSQGFTDSSKISSVNNNVSVTLLFEL